ncbi:MAG TPA: DUF1707 domain-containing protein [Nocardioides sp.]|uniref:DUF1707 SHOCT-like domain-containing protein n=1 Tax=Nocardioides sp. TaxID=35761 RepID=UPI002D7E878C|nr:DUF1707 domain-containing protein [Nocardioides sp.]HET6654372.1 DUF1707 domain-containing protein [Nocardioides sp.]
MSTPGRPELRISDEEREAAVASLGEHYAAGRLTKDEYDERASVAFKARTASALRPLFVDLPGPHPFAATPRTGVPRFGAPGFAAAGFGATGGQPRPPAGPGRRPGFRMPFMPLFLVLIGLSILFGTPWLIFIGLGALWFAKLHRRGSAWSGHGSAWDACGSTSRTRGSR